MSKEKKDPVKLKIEKILLDLDIDPKSQFFMDELENAYVARVDAGFTWKRIEKMIEQRSVEYKEIQ